jgi:hypothetical protein
LQATVLHHLGIGGIRPDLCLVVACLVGFVTDEVEGALFGLALGFVQDLFSPSDVWLNMLTKGVIGGVGGMMGRHLANATAAAVLGTLAALSLLSGLVFLIWARGAAGWLDVWDGVRTVLVPQALFDTGLGAIGYWVIASRGWVRVGAEQDG